MSAECTSSSDALCRGVHGRQRRKASFQESGIYHCLLDRDQEKLNCSSPPDGELTYQKEAPLTSPHEHKANFVLRGDVRPFNKGGKKRERDILKKQRGGLTAQESNRLATRSGRELRKKKLRHIVLRAGH